jgi:predicted MPP superfamily phosphohydrolase
MNTPEFGLFRKRTERWLKKISSDKEKQMQKKKINSRVFKDGFNLYCITDAHIGAKDHDKAKFDKVIKALKDDPKGYCFFNGDNLEFIPPGYYISQEGQDAKVDTQVEDFVKLLKSLKNKILFIRTGNHEARAMDLCGVDIVKNIARETGLVQLGMGMEMFKIVLQKGKEKKEYSLVTSHGEGGNSKKILDNMQLTFPGADFYFSGHTHELQINEGYCSVDTSGEFEEMKKMILVVGGSFSGWADYAREKNRRPLQTGCYVFTVNWEGIKLKGRF